MTLRIPTVAFLLLAAGQAACAPAGAGRRGGLAPPEEAWGKAHAESATGRTPTAGELLKQAEAARDEGRHARCADLAAKSAHELPEGDASGRARHRLLEARCRRADGQLGVALRSLSEAWPDLSSPVDRAWASAEARDLALHGLGRAEAAAFSGKIDGDLAKAWLGVRMALLAKERGDTTAARARLEAVAEPLEKVGADAALASLRRRFGGPSGGVRALGAVLPLTGPLRRVGERALRGLLLVDDLAIVVRDSGGDPDRAAAAVAELAEDPSILGIVGPLDRTAAQAAAKAAQQAGVPLITLSVDSGVTDAGDQVFRNFVDPDAEAAAVGAYAVRALGLKRLAVLRPANGYGKRLAAAFDRAVTGAGGAVVATGSYRGREFAPAVAALRKGPSFDGLFIPDTHARVALLAPHLAAAGLRSTFRAEDDGKGGDDRPVQLLGAGGWAHRDLLAHGGDRYLNGAVFAAGWWPDATPPEAVRFGGAIAERGGEPELFAAYAYDSARRLARAAVAADGRADVRRALSEGRWEGAVATLGFDPTRNPDAPPHLVRVKPVGLSAIPRNEP